MDELIKQFNEVKQWHKTMKIAMIAMITAGGAALIFGAVSIQFFLPMLVIGLIFIVGGIAVMFVARRAMNKAETMMVECMKRLKFSDEEIAKKCVELNISPKQIRKKFPDIFTNNNL